MQKWGVMIALVIALSAKPAIAAYPADGLVARYSMEETFAEGSGTTMVDGVIGKARQFNGSGDFLSFSDTDLPSGNAAVSVAFWFKTNANLSLNNYSIAFSYGTEAVGQKLYFGLGNDPNISQNALFIGIHGAAVGATGPANDNGWRHGTAVYDGNAWKIYLDGRLANTKTMTTNIVKTGKARIGSGSSGASQNYWNGIIDELAIYNRALTENEITAIYSNNCGLGMGKPVNLTSGTLAPGNRTLSWNSVAGAAYYFVRVDDLANAWSLDCDHPNIGDVCDDTQNTIQPSYVHNFLPGHQYRFWVHAVNSCGAAGPNSDLVNISIVEEVAVGAIRWDSWYGPNQPGEIGSGPDVEKNLSFSRYRYRLPFFAVEKQDGTVETRCITQDCMDQEIAYAKNAGLDYWATFLYKPGSGFDRQRNLYFSSTHQNDIKFAAILDRDDGYAWYGEDALTQLVIWFKQPNYQTVSGGRPLVFLSRGEAIPKQYLDSLRSKALAAGVANLYIVGMGHRSYVETLGLDAVSAYNTFMVNRQPYSELVAYESNSWETDRINGYKVIPWVTVGLDPRPRFDGQWRYYNVPEWEYLQQGTPTQIADHLRSAINWVNTNPITAEAKAVLIYAWNEFDEGMNIEPTKYFGAEKLNAIATVLGGIQQEVNLPPVIGVNLAKNKPVASSSVKSGSANINLTDGNPATVWEANGQGGSWVEIDLGQEMPINTFVIREDPTKQKIYSYRLSVFSGGAWTDFYTGIRPGPYDKIQTSRQVGTKLRFTVTGVYDLGSPSISELEVYDVVVPTGISGIFKAISEFAGIFGYTQAVKSF